MDSQQRLPNILEKSSIGALVVKVEEHLKRGGIEQPKREAEVLLMGLLDCRRSELYLRDFTVAEDFLQKVNFICKKRIDGSPIAYLLGFTDFMGSDFQVNPSVLIPRSDTEVLVGEAIKIIQNKLSDLDTVNVIDVGTGSGNIAITIAKTFPKAKVYAVDVSSESIAVARKNAQKHGVQERVDFVISDMFANIDVVADIIVSNPPYIPTDDLADLPIEVRMEPRISLNGGFDGMMYHKRLIRDGVKFLKDNGYMLFEIGIDQSEPICSMIESDPSWRRHYTLQDYHRIERAVVLQKKKTAASDTGRPDTFLK